MPVYEYRCKSCGKISEFLVKTTTDKVDISCKYCGAKELQKMFSRSFIAMGTPASEAERATCCGRDQRCNTPPCSSDGICTR